MSLGVGSRYSCFARVYVIFSISFYYTVTLESGTEGLAAALIEAHQLTTETKTLKNMSHCKFHTENIESFEASSQYYMCVIYQVFYI